MNKSLRPSGSKRHGSGARNLAAAMTLLLALSLLLTACSSAPATAPASTGQGAAAAKPVTIRFTSDQPVNHFTVPPMQDFAKKLEEASKGTIKVQTFPAGQLYHDPDALQQLAAGGLEMQLSNGPVLDNIIPAAKVLDLPYIVPGGSADTFRKLVDPKNSPYGKMLAADLDKKGIVLLSYWPTQQLIVFSKKPIEGLDSFKGTKVRVIGGDVWNKTMQAYGAQPMTILPAELPSMMAQGAVTAAFGSWAYWLGNYPDVKYGFDPKGMFVVGYPIMVSKTFWTSLTDEQRQTITSVLNEVTQSYLTSLEQSNTDTVNKLKAQGRVINSMSDADLAKAKAAVQPIYDQFRQQNGSDALDAALNALK